MIVDVDDYLPYSEPKPRIYERLEYTFTWLIENYSYCLQKNGQELESPMFTVNGLEDISWYIQLYPRGSVIKHPENISIFLRRGVNDGFPEIIPVQYELSLLAADGSAAKTESFNYDFKRGNVNGSVEFLPISDLFLEHKDVLLPQDTLSVSCKMWIYDSEIVKIGQSFARTRIRVEHFYFMQVVEGFSGFEHKEKKIIFKKERGIGFMKATLKLSDSNGTIILKITPHSGKKVLSTCNLFLMGASGILTPCVKGDNRADAKRKDISKLPLTLTKWGILKKKDEYLPDDKLTVLCQCSFSSGWKYNKIEKTVCDIPSAVLNQINDLGTEKPSACSSVGDLIKL